MISKDDTKSLADCRIQLPVSSVENGGASADAKIRTQGEAKMRTQGGGGRQGNAKMRTQKREQR